MHKYVGNVLLNLKLYREEIKGDRTCPILETLCSYTCKLPNEGSLCSNLYFKSLLTMLLTCVQSFWYGIAFVTFKCDTFFNEKIKTSTHGSNDYFVNC